MNGNVEATVCVNIAQLCRIDGWSRGILSSIANPLHLRQISGNSQKLTKELCLVVFVTDCSTLACNATSA